MRARLAPRLAWATRTRASAASRAATRRSTSALETKPRDDQRLGPVQLLLGEAGVGAGDVDLGGELRRFLRLDGAVDDRERLAGADPLAGLDEDADHLAALAGDSDRHVVAGGELAGGGDDAGDLLAAGDDDADRRRRLGALAAGLDRDLGVAAAAAEHEEGGGQQDQHGDHGEDDVPAPAAGGGRIVDDDHLASTAPLRHLRDSKFIAFIFPHTGQGGRPLRLLC